MRHTVVSRFSKLLRLTTNIFVVLVPRLKNIVNVAWELDDFDMAKLSRYMRVLFQQAIQHGGSAVDLLESIESHAAESADSEVPYPPEELEWIATTAFNKAVDFYCVSEDENCRLWAVKAIGIAHCCPDGGVLESVLQDKFLGLNWDVKK